ncbi:hypothetical protein ILYODFUR_033432 [Ilyodon furcidens]|uniref:Uncharacterized protein n=1 Tax=Ilyodon furcidens TaxID=33524 RepID=A0ABV0TQ55_9TELE
MTLKKTDLHVLVNFYQRINHHTQIFHKRTAVGEQGTNHTVMSMQEITFPNSRISVLPLFRFKKVSLNHVCTSLRQSWSILRADGLLLADQFECFLQNRGK